MNTTKDTSAMMRQYPAILDSGELGELLTRGEKYYRMLLRADDVSALELNESVLKKHTLAFDIKQGLKQRVVLDIYVDEGFLERLRDTEWLDKLMRFIDKIAPWAWSYAERME